MKTLQDYKKEFTIFATEEHLLHTGKLGKARDYHLKKITEAQLSLLEEMPIEKTGTKFFPHELTGEMGQWIEGFNKAKDKVQEWKNNKIKELK